MRFRLALVMTLVGCGLAGAADAQKAKDTLRAAVYQPIDAIDDIVSPNPEAALLTRPVAETLLYYNADTRRTEPLLASVWRQIDDKTLELTLRRDVTFHDGTPMSADDVVAMLNYVADPKETFRFRESRFGWIAGAEKVDHDRVRIRTFDVQANALARLTQGPPIYPAQAYSGARRTDFGRHPVATGPYKVASFEAGVGAVLVKDSSYAHGGARPAARIGRVEVSIIGDQQTQIGRLITGEQDFVYGMGIEQARDLAKRPGLRMRVSPTIAFAYFALDAADRSGIGVFKDKRVREAMMSAIDREGLRRALLPAEMQNSPLQNALCHPWVEACDSSIAPPAYDPARAKKLLAEAGLAAGFDVTISATTTTRNVAEAVSGQLRAVGVRANVEASTIGVWLKKRAEGKMQSTVGLWDNAGGAPDAEWTTNFFFLGDSSDYAQDRLLQDWGREGARTMDPIRRRAIYRDLFDRANSEAYAIPVIELPAIIVASKELVFEGDNKKPEGFEFHRIRWTE